MYLSKLDSLFDTHFTDVVLKNTRSNERIKENENGTGIIIEVPGVKADDLKLTVKNRVLDALVCTKNDWGEEFQWKRRFRLNIDHDPTNIKAQIIDGVLKIFIPKMRESSEEIKIELSPIEHNIFKDLIA